MARTNINDRRVEPRTGGLVRARVLRREQLSPSFLRITLGGGTLDSFVPLGYDQWFRLCLPVSGDSLEHAPDRLTTGAYLRLLTVAKGHRPVLRNYTVREFRPEGPDGPELDVDFVVHIDAQGRTGAAVRWAQECVPGDVVGLIDEGRTFNPPADTSHVVLAADETGVPAAAGILASLPADTVGQAWLEVPEAADRRDLAAPDGVEVTWLTRQDPHAIPGAACRAHGTRQPVAPDGFYGWAVGESELPTGLRRHWVGQGVPKDRITFCGYWKQGRKH